MERTSTSVRRELDRKESSIGYGKRSYKTELRIGHIVLVDVRPSSFDHLRSHIDTNHMSPLTDFICSEETIESATGAEVKDYLSRFE